MQTSRLLDHLERAETDLERQIDELLDDELLDGETRWPKEKIKILEMNWFLDLVELRGFMSSLEAQTRAESDPQTEIEDVRKFVLKGELAKMLEKGVDSLLDDVADEIIKHREFSQRMLENAKTLSAASERHFQNAMQNHRDCELATRQYNLAKEDVNLVDWLDANLEVGVSYDGRPMWGFKTPDVSGSSTVRTRIRAAMRAQERNGDDSDVN